MGAGGNIGAFKIGSGNTSLFLYILIAAVAIALIIVIYKQIKIRYQRYKAAQEDNERFLRVCRKRKLSRQEVEFIQEIAQKYNLKRLLLLVRNIRVFDRYMAREVSLYRDEESKKKERFKVFVFELRKKLGFANFESMEELTSSRPLQEGTRVKTTIEIANMQKNFEGKITTVDEEGITLSVPDHFMKEEPIRAGQNVSLVVTHHEDAEYDFKTQVYKVILGPPGFIALEHSRSFTRNQKRKYPRLNVEIPFQYFLLDRLQEKEFRERRTVTITPETRMLEGSILNISGGGCFFNSGIEYEPGNLIWMSFYLDESGEELKDLVGHVERLIDLEDNQHRIIMHFAKIMDKYRDKIIRYVYAKKTAEKEAKKAVAKKSKPKKVKVA